MTIPMTRVSLRMTEEQHKQLVADARTCHLSTNRYILLQALSGARDQAQVEQIKAAVAAVVAGQIDELAGELASIDTRHAEQDRKLREDLRSSLHVVLDRVGVPAVKRALGVVDK